MCSKPVFKVCYYASGGVNLWCLLFGALLFFAQYAHGQSSDSTMMTLPNITGTNAAIPEGYIDHDGENTVIMLNQKSFYIDVAPAENLTAEILIVGNFTCPDMITSEVNLGFNISFNDQDCRIAFSISGLMKPQFAHVMDGLNPKKLTLIDMKLMDLSNTGMKFCCENPNMIEQKLRVPKDCLSQLSGSGSVRLIFDIKPTGIDEDDLPKCNLNMTFNKWFDKPISTSTSTSTVVTTEFVAGLTKGSSISSDYGGISSSTQPYKPNDDKTKLYVAIGFTAFCCLECVILIPLIIYFPIYRREVLRHNKRIDEQQATTEEEDPSEDEEDKEEDEEDIEAD